MAEKGAVLNNVESSTNAMAGWVQGNLNLARGEAKVILNEVNSANPSRLKGYVEVAGKSRCGGLPTQVVSNVMAVV